MQQPIKNQPNSMVVIKDGFVYRMTRRNFLLLCREGAEGRPTIIDNTNSTYLGELQRNLTAYTKEDYTDEL